MSRSIWKGPYVPSSLLKKLSNLKDKDNASNANVSNANARSVNKNLPLSKGSKMHKGIDAKQGVASLKVWARSTTIISSLIGQKLEVHNGRRFIPLKITDKMIGYKVGAFVPTRIVPKHPPLKSARNPRVVRDNTKKTR